jgi:hypothetical protein
MTKTSTKNLILKDLNIFDEFEGSEIETKLEVYPRKPDFFIHLFKKNLKKNKKSLFRLVPKREEILNWTYYFDRYVYERESKFIEAFILIHHPKKEKFWIKAKESPRIKRSRDKILIRKERLVRFERKMTKIDTNLILQRKTKELGEKIFLLGRIKRDKFYLLLQNIKTGRYYSVSADQCQYKKFSLSQIEIEYKGIAKIKKIKAAPFKLRKLISQEIFMLSEFLMKKINKQFKFKKTKQTKFEWLCSCTKIKRKKDRSNKIKDR